MTVNSTSGVEGRITHSRGVLYRVEGKKYFHSTIKGVLYTRWNRCMIYNTCVYLHISYSYGSLENGICFEKFSNHHGGLQLHTLPNPATFQSTTDHSILATFLPISPTLPPYPVTFLLISATLPPYSSYILSISAKLPYSSYIPSHLS
jgi:hypothetical protein